MMKPLVYVFHIDAFTPDTLPMARLAEYMATLAKLIGFQEHTHFVRLERGSARLVHQVDPVDAPKVQARLYDVASGVGPKDAAAAMTRLNEMLANDNAVGGLIEEEGGKVIEFPGRLQPKALAFPAFRQDGAIEGQVVSVGGRDATAHAILQDGEVTYSGLSMKRDVARELAHYLYGPKIRLIGNGRWERHANSTWKLIEFRVERFEQLDERPLAAVLNELRGLPDNGLMNPSAYRDVFDLGSSEDEGQPH